MAIHNTYDHALKILARTYPHYFLSLTLPNVPVQLIGTQQNVELALEIDRVDFLHEIVILGDRAYLHFDFELEHTDPFPRRVFVYNGMLTELKKPVTVISIPIYVKPRKKEIPKAYEAKVGGYVFHKFTYSPILLWEHIDDIRSGKLYPLAPFLVLLTKEPSEEMLVIERELIVKHEPDPIRRRTLFVTAILTALAQKVFEPDFLWAFFKEEDMLLAEDPVLNRWFNERYGVKLAEAEANFAQAERKFKRQAEHKLEVARQTALQMEAAWHNAETARREAEVKAARREAEAEAKVEAARREVEAARREAEARAEAARREAEARAEAARREAEARAEAARREAEAEAARREAEAEAAKARAEWLSTITKFLMHRFANAPLEVVLDLQRVSDRQHSQVIDLALDAPDLATFRQELKGLLSAGE